MTDLTAVTDWPRSHLAEFLDLPETGIDPLTPFAELGLSSMETVFLTGASHSPPPSASFSGRRGVR
ncbi:hypothetical protein ABZX85_36950 [Streptomyces sp. NPDC004539]|uniref:hypothetical protein n=1 Tax=Streptomyces sp. NPDC004539 TaxID=3154280 RepID=UPI0033B21E8B